MVHTEQSFYYIGLSSVCFPRRFHAPCYPIPLYFVFHTAHPSRFVLFRFVSIRVASCRRFASFGSALHFVLFRFVSSFRFAFPFRFVPLLFISLRFVSPFRFVSFRPVSCLVVPLRFVLFRFVSFYSVSFGSPITNMRARENDVFGVSVVR